MLWRTRGSLVEFGATELIKVPAFAHHACAPWVQMSGKWKGRMAFLLLRKSSWTCEPVVSVSGMDFNGLGEMLESGAQILKRIKESNLINAIHYRRKTFCKKKKLSKYLIPKMLWKYQLICFHAKYCPSFSLLLLDHLVAYVQKQPASLTNRRASN